MNKFLTMATAALTLSAMFVACKKNDESHQLKAVDLHSKARAITIQRGAVTVTADGNKKPHEVDPWTPSSPRIPGSEEHHFSGCDDAPNQECILRVHANPGTSASMPVSNTDTTTFSSYDWSHGEGQVSFAIFSTANDEYPYTVVLKRGESNGAHYFTNTDAIDMGDLLVDFGTDMQVFKAATRPGIVTGNYLAIPIRDTTIFEASFE